MFNICMSVTENMDSWRHLIYPSINFNNKFWPYMVIYKCHSISMSVSFMMHSCTMWDPISPQNLTHWLKHWLKSLNIELKDIYQLCKNLFSTFCCCLYMNSQTHKKLFSWKCCHVNSLHSTGQCLSIIEDVLVSRPATHSFTCHSPDRRWTLNTL